MACLSYSCRLPSLFPKHLSSLPFQIGAFASRRGNGSSSVRLTGSSRSGVKVFALVQGGDESEGDEDVGGIRDYEGDERDEEAVASVSPERWDVLGLGQAMVDFSGMVEDEFLEKLGLEEGTRKVVNHEERGRVLRAMDGCTYKAAAGGSLSNTLVALARLGSRSVGASQLNIAMTGSIGSDPLGSFYRAKLRRANVHFLSNPVKDGTTGTVIVLTTPDAQRTMLAYQEYRNTLIWNSRIERYSGILVQFLPNTFPTYSYSGILLENEPYSKTKGTSSTVSYDPYLESLVSKTNILIVEGYLFEFPDTIETIKRACQDARASGALVAVTASDVSCIKRCYDDFWDIIRNHTDILFANSNEAHAFCNLAPDEAPRSVAQHLSHSVPLVSVTDGAQGSYLSVKGEAIYIPPSPCRPVDTCGAGDAYASGILYGVLRGASDLKSMGILASRVAAVVVGQQGTRLRVHDAERLAESFEWQLEKSRLV